MLAALDPGALLVPALLLPLLLAVAVLVPGENDDAMLVPPLSTQPAEVLPPPLAVPWLLGPTPPEDPTTMPGVHTPPSHTWARAQSIVAVQVLRHSPATQRCVSPHRVPPHVSGEGLVHAATAPHNNSNTRTPGNPMDRTLAGPGALSPSRKRLRQHRTLCRPAPAGAENVSRGDAPPGSSHIPWDRPTHPELPWRHAGLTRTLPLADSPSPWGITPS